MGGHALIKTKKSKSKINFKEIGELALCLTYNIHYPINEKIFFEFSPLILKKNYRKSL